MPNADFDAAVTEAAQLLSRSDHPVIAGHIADVAAAIAAFRLAKAIGGVVDHFAAEASLRDQAILADAGSMLVSPSEARQRADTFFLVGDEPLRAWPDLTDFLFAAGPTLFVEEMPARRIVSLSSREVGPWLAGDDVLWHTGDAGEIPVLLGALRARIVGHPIAQSVDPGEIDRLAEILRGAKYGVALWSAGELDALTLEMLTGLIKDLNAETRWSGMSIVEDAGAVGATMVAGWMSGFPLRTGFGRIYPEHDAWQFDAHRLVEFGEADAVVWVAAPGEAPPAWLGEIPIVVVSHDLGASAAEGRVGLGVGLPGIDYDGVVYDRRTGTLVRVAATAPSGLPSVADALDRIAARLP
jgi:formylmethanofuran dehydrogenase subunit B